MLAIEQIEKAYSPGLPVLQDVSLEIAQGEVLCLLGPSGCGKSTLLRIVAGLETADRGTLTIDGRDLTTIPVHQRHFGLMFQEFALFPHRTVAENVAFGLRMAGKGRSEIAARIQEVLTLVDLRDYGHRSIFDLSGGERQRVALARSLAPRPRLLMLDEPLGSLDRTLRDELVAELRTILKEVHATALYVTHDQQEAFAIADRLVVMRAGRIAQIGTPYTVYHAPANAFVARFLGLTNLLPVQQPADQPGYLQTPVGRWHLPALVDAVSAAMATPALLLIRPDSVVTLEPAALPRDLPRDQPTVTGVVQLLSFRGSTYRLVVAVDPVATFMQDKDAAPTAHPNRPYHLEFDIPAALVAPHVNAVTVGESVVLQLNAVAMSLVRQ